MDNFNIAGRATKDVWTNGSDEKAATVARGTLAVSRPGSTKDNPKTDFIKFRIIGPAAETARKCFKKGTQIGITGRLEVDSYEKDGEKKTIAEVVTPTFEFISGTGANVNNGNLIARLVRDPEEIKNSKGEVVGCRMTVATDRPRRSKDAEEKTDFIKVTVFGKQAEPCLRYLAKGRQVTIDGRINAESYEKDGKWYDSVSVIASNVKFMGDGKKDEEEKKENDTAEQFAAENPIENLDDIDDLAGIDEEDIPF